MKFKKAKGNKHEIDNKSNLFKAYNSKWSVN